MDREEKKAAEEREVFRTLIERAALPIDKASINSRRPPEPDILANSEEGLIAFELVELCDPDVARTFNQRMPPKSSFAWLGGANLDAVRAKFTNTYHVSCPLELLCYQADRDPTPSDILIPTLIDELDFAAQKTFRRVWYMDKETVAVL